MKLLWIIPLSCLIFSSCIIHTDFRGYQDDYNNLTNDQITNVIVTDKPIDSLGYDKNVYIISPRQVKEYLSSQDSCIVYTWIPYCTSEDCIAPYLFEDYCEQHHYTPIILMSNFYWEYMPEKGSIHIPILFLDNRAYGTRFSRKYCKMILADLSDGKIEKNDYSIFFLFKNGQYIKSIGHLGND